VYAGIHLYLNLPAIHAYTYTNSASSVANCNGDDDSNFYSNIYPNCHRFRQSDAYAQTDAYRKAAFDTEAASDSAAKAGRTQLIG
jgi:hypothetical protein